MGNFNTKSTSECPMKFLDNATILVSDLKFTDSNCLQITFTIKIENQERSFTSFILLDLHRKTHLEILDYAWSNIEPNVISWIKFIKNEKCYKELIGQLYTPKEFRKDNLIRND